MKKTGKRCCGGRRRRPSAPASFDTRWLPTLCGWAWLYMPSRQALSSKTHTPAVMFHVCHVRLELGLETNDRTTNILDAIGDGMAFRRKWRIDQDTRRRVSERREKGEETQKKEEKERGKGRYTHSGERGERQCTLGRGREKVPKGDTQTFHKDNVSKACLSLAWPCEARSKNHEGESSRLLLNLCVDRL